jgi:coenzyme F420-reducing hydrogenase gamma subunit
MEKPKKIKLGIFDFTDCEGCEAEIISLGEKLLAFSKRIEIVNWRLGQQKADWKEFDAVLIEGTPLRPEEIELLKFLRIKSKLVIGLGSCATLGGIPAIINKEERKKWYRKIYGPKYKGRGIDALPINAYVKIDFLIHGCPISGSEVTKIISDLIAGKKLNYKNYPVCFECKIVNLPCRLLEEKPCLGPITQGGCEAVCLKGGAACYGCFGLRKGANIEALLKILEKFSAPEEIKNYFSMFHNKTKFQ